jgi:hypothetical protein
MASALLWINGLGFGVPCVLAIRALQAGRGIPFILGFPAYGLGPFERHGYGTTVPLLAGFLAICIAEIVAGALLWHGSRAGAYLAFALLPLGAMYWWGFALPLPPVFALVRTVAIVLSWRTLA